YGWPIAPLILGFILGPMFEKAVRRSVSMGGFGIFAHRPIALFFIVSTIVMVWVLLRFLRRAPKELPEEAKA
ncbi:MAG TPA: hypothetical protein VMG58_08050, partial [Candidatus Sulfotelmatobacter sp.]|nr:hypothetical protein [Candidatus Sulfotelmatobacter sp.]